MLPVDNGITTIRGDGNGDKNADFSITVVGHIIDKERDLDLARTLQTVLLKCCSNELASEKQGGILTGY